MVDTNRVAECARLPIETHFSHDASRLQVYIRNCFFTPEFTSAASPAEEVRSTELSH